VYEPTPEQWDKNNVTKKGRRDNPQPVDNPLLGKVTERSVKYGQAWTMDMYLREALNRNPDYKPSDREPVREATDNPCVFVELSTGRLQVMLCNTGTRKRELNVEGCPASPSDLATIETYRKAKGLRDPKHVPVKFIYVDNLSNVEGNWEALQGDED
jgi:hypothetical protein